MEWVTAALSLAGVVAVAVIGGRNARRTALVSATTPAYDQLLKEIQDLRDDRKEDRSRIEHLETAWDDEKRLRRELDGRVVCLEKAKDADRAWIRRIITAIRNQAPEHVDLLRPFPDWHETDPDGFPPID